MPYIRTSQIQDDIIYMPHVHLSKVRTIGRSHNSALRSNRNHIYQWIVLALTMFSICACSFVIIISFTYSERYGTQETGITKYIACIDCSEDDYIPHHLLEAVSRRDFDGLDQCCAYTTKELSALLEITMTRKEVIKTLPAFDVTNFSLIPASTHVGLLPPLNDTAWRNRIVFSSNFITILIKKVNSPFNSALEHCNQIELLPDGFKIIKSGVYYLYSSIHYSVGGSNSCSSLQYKIWYNCIEKNKVELFTSSHTCCDDCSVNEEISYTGGTARLSAGDIINIKISGYGLAYFNKSSSFAGLFMMENDY